MNANSKYLIKYAAAHLKTLMQNQLTPFVRRLRIKAQSASASHESVDCAGRTSATTMPVLPEVAVKLKFLALLPFLFAASAVAQVYALTDLGFLSPTSINAWAQVAGNANGQAYIWTSTGGLRPLGLLPGGSFSYADAINDTGAIAGYADGDGTVISTDSSIPNQSCTALTQPFLWTPRKGMQGLGTVGVPPAEIVSPSWCEIQFYTTGINNFGAVVGYTVPYYDEYQWAFAWTKSQGWTASTALFGDSFPPSEANAVRDSGQAFGQTGVLLGQATSWTSAGVATDLGTLDGGTALGYSSSANAANEQGIAVGWSTTESLTSSCQDNLIGCTLHAARWTKNGSITDLGTLAGDTLSAASAINFFGQVIGTSGSTLVELGWGGNGGAGFDGTGGVVAVVGRPFVWSAGRGMQDLNTLLRGAPGWVLNSVSGINFWGQIVGTGTLNGTTHGFLLTPAK